MSPHQEGEPRLVNYTRNPFKDGPAKVLTGRLSELTVKEGLAVATEAAVTVLAGCSSVQVTSEALASSSHFEQKMFSDGKSFSAVGLDIPVSGGNFTAEELAVIPQAQKLLDALVDSGVPSDSVAQMYRVHAPGMETQEMADRSIAFVDLGIGAHTDGAHDIQMAFSNEGGPVQVIDGVMYPSFNFGDENNPSYGWLLSTTRDNGRVEPVLGLEPKSIFIPGASSDEFVLFVYPGDSQDDPIMLSVRHSGNFDGSQTFDLSSWIGVTDVHALGENESVPKLTATPPPEKPVTQPTASPDTSTPLPPSAIPPTETANPTVTKTSNPTVTKTAEATLIAEQALIPVDWSPFLKCTDTTCVVPDLKTIPTTWGKETEIELKKWFTEVERVNPRPEKNPSESNARLLYIDIGGTGTCRIDGISESRKNEQFPIEVIAVRPGPPTQDRATAAVFMILELPGANGSPIRVIGVATGQGLEDSAHHNDVLIKDLMARRGAGSIFGGFTPDLLNHDYIGGAPRFGQKLLPLMLEPDGTFKSELIGSALGVMTPKDVQKFCDEGVAPEGWEGAMTLISFSGASAIEMLP